MISLQKIVFFLFFCICITALQAQFIDTKNTIPLKPGTTFYYAVRRCEGCYDLAVSLKNYLPNKNLTWEWKSSTGVTAKKGSIAITENALQKADKVIYNFSKGKQILQEDEIAFRLSTKNFNQIVQSWAAEIEIADQIRLFSHIYKTRFPVTIANQPFYLECYQIWADDGTMLWILDNANFPLILKIELGFELELMTIE